MKPTHNQLKAAAQYVNYGVKEGFLNKEDFSGLEDAEFIRKVEEIQNNADYEYDRFRDERSSHWP